MRYAVVDQAGYVVNSIELYDLTQWKPPEGCQVIRHESASSGWTYKGGVFIAPICNPAPAVPVEQQITMLEAQNLLPRPVRDLLLKDTTAPGYAKVRSLDDQIAALRAQLTKE